MNPRQQHLESMAQKHMDAAAPGGPPTAPGGPPTAPGGPPTAPGGGDTWDLGQGFTATMDDPNTITVAAPDGQTRTITRESEPKIFEQILATKQQALERPPEAEAEMTMEGEAPPEEM